MLQWVWVWRIAVLRKGLFVRRFWTTVTGCCTALLVVRPEGVLRTSGLLAASGRLQRWRFGLMTGQVRQWMTLPKPSPPAPEATPVTTHYPGPEPNVTGGPVSGGRSLVIGRFQVSQASRAFARATRRIRAQ